MAASVTLAACGSGSAARGRRPTQHASSQPVVPDGPARTGLYIVDGTNAHRGHGGVMWHLAESFAGAHTFYLRGPMLEGTVSSTLIRNALVRQICDDLTSGAINRYAVAGYSRGAVIAVDAAQRVSGPDSECPRPANSASRLVWVGLLDAVDTSIWHFSKDVPAGVRFIHVHKLQEMEHVLSTVTVQGSPGLGRTIRIDTDHEGIACRDHPAAAQAFSHLIEHSSQAEGMAWNPVPLEFDCEDAAVPRGPGRSPLPSGRWPGWF